MTNADDARGRRLASMLGGIFTVLLWVIGAGLIVLAAATVFAVAAPEALAERMQARTAAGPIDLAVGYNAVWTMGWAVAVMVLFGVVVWQLRALLRTVAAAAPFDPANADRLRVIAGVMGVLLIVQAVAGFLAPPSVAADSTVVGRFDLGLFLGMLVTLVLAEVFREGTRLRADADGTI